MFAIKTKKESDGNRNNEVESSSSNNQGSPYIILATQYLQLTKYTTLQLDLKKFYRGQAFTFTVFDE